MGGCRRPRVGADAATALAERISITPANVNDGRAGPDALPDDPGEVFADSAYRGSHFGGAVRVKGGTPRVVATGMWGRDERETFARLNAWNQPIHRVRGWEASQRSICVPFASLPLESDSVHCLCPRGSEPRFRVGVV